ncbi:MAG: hypothetical protein SGBAC_007298 [Bacillariaceae sp.]
MKIYNTFLFLTMALPTTGALSMIETVHNKLGTVATIGALSLGIVATSTSTEAAVAADVDQGQKIFNANCAACHRGGQNMIAPEKTLEKAALEQFLSSNKERSTEESVKWQISHGRSSMPSFGGRLDDESIANVAAYVIKSSEEGWNN